MEAQRRADLLSKKVLLDPILTPACQKSQKRSTTVSHIWVLIFQQYMPEESSVGLDGVSAVEQPLRPAKTLEAAAATLNS